MIYRYAADAVVLIHMGFILFVVLGGFLALKWPRLVWLHAPAAVWGALIEFGGWICPLTPLENSLRIAGGDPGYTGGFIEQYLIPLIYPASLTPRLQLALGAGVILINAAAYALILLKRFRGRR